MISIDRVEDILRAVCDYNDGDIERYSAIIEAAVSSAEKKAADESLHSDERIVMLAAAQANYSVCLAAGADDITSFTAGDISLSRGSDALSRAKLFLQQAQEQCASIISDSGFAFIDV